MQPKKFNYLKTFLLGFGFFGVSVIWGIYNAFVPLYLANKFGVRPGMIGFFMTLDNIAALFIQPLRWVPGQTGFAHALAAVSPSFWWVRPLQPSPSASSPL